jgi:hypothetical protein
MSIGKAQAAQAPTAMGSLLQASTYGAAIPTIYGMTLSPLLAIWAANLRQGGSIKKFKQLKKGITAYVENIDFLIGHNPIIGVNQMWNNGATIPLVYTTYVHTGANGSVTIPASPPPNASNTFYSVIGITMAAPYTVTFNDYGGNPVTLSGTTQIPMWNELVAGPDPTHSSSVRNYPYCYRWEPSYGATVYFDHPNFFTNVITIYYTQTNAATSYQGPLAHNRLAFEPQLGSGTEYSDAGLSAQQIIYPMFAGIESSDIDLGSSGALPQLQAEVQGKFGLYATGDADFADMIEDVFKSGVAQAALGAGPSFTQVEHGLSCYRFPGCIQSKTNTTIYLNFSLPYNQPTTAGNYLLVIVTCGNDQGTLGISDTTSNTWTPIFPSTGTDRVQAWYAKANGGACTCSFSGLVPLSDNMQISMYEIAGVDMLDSVTLTNSITTTNQYNFPAYILGLGLWDNAGTNPPNPRIPHWNALLAADVGAYGTIASPYQVILERTVNSPGTYGLVIPPYGSAPHSTALLAFKATQPANYPKPLGDFLDTASLDQVRFQCRANGLYGSLSMTAQQAASDWLKTLYDAADAAPVYMGFKLYSMPYSEVSAVGNGVVYNALTAPGPTYNLSTENGDFCPSGNDAPIKVSTSARINQPNVLQMQCLNRTSNYNPSLVEHPDAAGISLFGVRKADPITNNAVQDVSIARQLLGIQVRKLQYGGDVYTFTIPAKWCLLAPMGAGGGGTSDAVITITDPLADISGIPVRLTSISEQADGSLDCEAEPFVYGMYAPTVFSADTPTPYDPGNVINSQSGGLSINPPIIFEATPRLAQQTSPAQIWIVTSCAQQSIYGGCQCYISTDGGSSYTLASSNPVLGSAMQATVGNNSFQNWPAGTDPDTTNNLFISSSVTLPNPPGTLPSLSPTQRDNFQYPCYVGFNNEATLDAEFLTGDTTQITELGVLFSNPTILNALPSDAVITSIFPMQFIEAGPTGSPVVTSIYSGTGLTPTSGGTLVQTITGPISAPLPTGGGSSIGTSLTGQEIRYNLKLNTTGPGAFGKVVTLGWAIYYSSATPNIDPLALVPFGAAAGFGFGWAIPKTVATGMVGSGTNATISAFGGIAPTGFGYEIMTYNDANLLAPGIYELMATGSGNELRRGVYGAPSPGVGMNHPPGSPFALLDPAGTGIFKINMDPAWIGTQLWFKFPTFNKFGNIVSSLQDVDAYPFTPTGAAGNAGPATGGILVNGS